MPATQAGYCGSVAPSSFSRSKPPSPRTASAQDASTTAWPSTARRSGPPRRAGAAATPIDRKRALSIAPVAIAVAASPPAASTAVAPNWADPAKTNTDITIGAIDPIVGWATTPNESPTTNAAAPKPTPARIPGR